MQSASGGRDGLGNLPAVRMSQLLAHITVNQSRRGFICCDVSQWVKYLLRLALKKKTPPNVRCERSWKQTESGSDPVCSHSPRFLSNANVGLSFPKWTRWMSRMCGCATFSHPHRLWLGVLVVRLAVGESRLSRPGPSVLSGRPADTQDEWIIYNHFSPGSSGWCDSWPPNSLNLIMCHSEAERSHNLPMLATLQPGQYGKQSLGRHTTKRWLPTQRAKVPCSLSVNDFVVICIIETELQFMHSGRWWCTTTVCSIKPRCMSASFRPSGSFFLLVRELESSPRSCTLLCRVAVSFRVSADFYVAWSHGAATWRLKCFTHGKSWMLHTQSVCRNVVMVSISFRGRVTTQDCLIGRTDLSLRALFTLQSRWTRFVPNM